METDQSVEARLWRDLIGIRLIFYIEQVFDLSPTFYLLIAHPATAVQIF